MDKELRKELRDWKAEVTDEIAMLKQQMATLLASQSTVSDAAVSDGGKLKKPVAEPAMPEKDAN